MLSSRFYKILDEVTAIVIINFLFLLMAIPIITLFPALFSMVSTVRNKVYRKDSEIVRYFFKSVWHYKWKANGIGLLLLLIGYSLFYYVYAFYTMDNTITVYLLPLSIIIFISYLLWTWHFIFTLTHFSFPMKQAIKHSLLATFYKPLHSILFMVYVLFVGIITFHLQILIFLGSFSLLAYGAVYMNLQKTSFT